MPLGLTVVASATDAAIYEKLFGPGNTTWLMISNDEMNDNIKIIKSLEEFGLLLKNKRNSETIKTKQ